ncbi:MAG: hypothetical protein Q8868_04340, partial [Bacteroidota bacterium]|nr:hypothetical protein [Bacteroidota bacterium]
QIRTEISQGKHSPVIEKPTKSFSIKEIISEERKAAEKDLKVSADLPHGDNETFEEFNAENFEKAWTEFTNQLKGEGTRIVSMFKSIRAKIENDHLVKLHLTNAAQKDIFTQNYRQKLLGFLDRRFRTSDLDVETVVDLSESNEVLYTDEQKYNYLVSKYPQLKDFRKTFNLDMT